MDGLGMRIRAARGDMPVDELARKVGVSAQTVYRWEWGNHTPSIRKLRLVAEATGTPLSELVKAAA